MSFAATLDRILEGERLEEDEARSMMDNTLDGDLGPERLAAFLVALRTRPPVADELVGFARSMRDHAIRIRSHHPILMDTCGTGGSPRKAFNVSTTTAFALAAAGVPVAKHGNRSVTRPSGSADVLEEAGLDLALPPAKAKDLLDEVGIAFLFAPAFHPSMKYAGPVRAQLGVSTIFNLLGPLANPAGPTHQILGVFDASLVPIMAESLQRLGARAGIVLHGEPGFDEATPCGAITVQQIKEDTPHTLDPQDLGLPRHSPDAIAAVARHEGPALMRAILDGKGPAACRDTVALNVALGLEATGKASDPADGLTQARELLASGAGAHRLDAYLEAVRA